MEGTEEVMQYVPCGECVYIDNKWADEPCCRCGRENSYAWAQDENGNFIRLKYRCKAKYFHGEESSNAKNN